MIIILFDFPSSEKLGHNKATGSKPLVESDFCYLIINLIYIFYKNIKFINLIIK